MSRSPRRPDWAWRCGTRSSLVIASEEGRAMRRERYMYSDLTWPELREAVKRQPVVLLPVGSVEDHGPHLPLDTDNFMPTAICRDTAARIPDEALVMPTVPYGFNWRRVGFA